MKIKIGTRGSKLALVQANYVCSILKKAYPEHQFEIEIIKTKGDLIQDKPLNLIGDKGLFVKEIEDKILKDEVHIGVHSMKDMPAVPANGLTFTKLWRREDPRDVLILREKKSLEELPPQAVIGTGSKRRAFQLLKLRSDLQIVDIRGNVDTRLRKMEEQKLDGIILAAAGLHRLGMKEKITQYLEPVQMIPAPAQGILALEVKIENKELIKMLDAFSDDITNETGKAERGFLQEIGGDCNIPIGAICSKNEEMYQLNVVFGNEDGSKMTYASVLGESPMEIAKKAAYKIRTQMAGKVYLVGAGPGNEELITIKGLRLIKEADCILYDRLSSPELLSYAKTGCEMIYVGKASHNHTMRQEDINKLLVKKAMQYEKVVRLKGGDIYVFGRGGEEALALRENGVPFEIVPGISSSIAGLAYAGIPITHRGVAAGFHVVTAHDQNDELADIDFDAMARSKDTCVFMMGLSKVKEIAENLLQAGKDPNTGAAVISCATTTNQQVCKSDLKHIAEEVKKKKLPSPALIVVGDVVDLREQLNFFEEKPLFGKKYLVPKIGFKTSVLAEKLRNYGANVEEVTVGEIVYVKYTITKEELEKVNWVVFTSSNGINGFFKNLKAAKLDVRSLGNVKIAVIGSETGKYLSRYGLQADLMPKEHNSDALCEALLERVVDTDVVWYPKAEITDENIQKKLAGSCNFVGVTVYENCMIKDIRIQEEFVKECDAVFFTCASSVKRVMEALDGVIPEKWKDYGTVISIGPKCSSILKEYGIYNYTEVNRASYDAMIEEVFKRGLDQEV